MKLSYVIERIFNESTGKRIVKTYQTDPVTPLSKIVMALQTSEKQFFKKNVAGGLMRSRHQAICIQQVDLNIASRVSYSTMCALP